jgi:hypothetical protein
MPETPIERSINVIIIIFFIKPRIFSSLTHKTQLNKTINIWNKMTDKNSRTIGFYMKLILFTFFMTFNFVSCDAPVRTRVPTSVDYANIQGNGNFNNNQGNGDGGVNTTSTVNNDSNNQEEPGFENCEYMSPEYNGGSIGNFGLCRHSSDERRYKSIFAQSNSAGTCFVPVHIQNNGNSFKLGIAECVHNNADTNYYMTLNKELVAPNFSFPRPEAINGVMVIATQSLNAYMGCMNSKEDYFLGTQGCCLQRVYNQSTNRYSCIQPNPQCESGANNYANNICSMFITNHGNNYRQVTF